jgi:rfaE bifunctional protein kinase chain/domain
MRRAASPSRVTDLPLRDLRDRLARAEVVVVGDFVADEYVFGETDRVSREAPVLVVRYERSQLEAGCAGNAAANLAALGVRVRAVGVVGADALGDQLLGALARSGVDVAGIQRVRGRATESKTRILAGGRSTRRQQVVRLDRADPEPLPGKVAERLARDVARASAGAGAVLASDYGSGVIGPAVLEALRQLDRGGVPVCGDSRHRLLQYAGLSVVKPNEPELEAASGIALQDPGAVERAGRALLRRLRCGALLVTRGRHGMSLFRPGQPALHVRAHGDREAVDVTGAGDTVGAAYTASIAAGLAPEAAVRIANVAGALVVLKPGTATVAPDELMDELVAERGTT